MNDDNMIRKLVSVFLRLSI